MHTTDTFMDKWGSLKSTGYRKRTELWIRSQELMIQHKKEKKKAKAAYKYLQTAYSAPE